MFNRGKKSSAPEPEQESILNYDDNFPIIDRDGIQPAINLCEGGDAKNSFKSTEYIRIYDLVFKMCIQREPFNYSGRLYTSYTTSIEQYCKNFHDAALTQAVSTTNDISLLRCWGTRWEKQKNVIMGVARLFTYLDRFHTQSTEAILPLANQGHAIYHQHVFNKFAPMVIKAIVRSIDRERNEEDVDRKLLHKAVISFEEMGTWVDKKLKIYKDLLEVKILQNASEFYRRTSRNWIQEDSTPQYLRKAEAMLAQEKTRVESYLNKCTMEPLKAKCYRELLKEHQKVLLDKKTGLDAMLLSNSRDDLARLYNLYNYCEPDSEGKRSLEPDLEPISRRFHDLVASEGKRISDEAKTAGVAADADPRNSLVSKLIALHDQYEGIVSKCFADNALFQRALKKAFETFINLDEGVSKLLAEYVNEVLKKGSKINIDSISLDSTLANIAYLYFYIHDKDVFESAYQNFLQNRLLNSEFENEHNEKKMIAKLKHGNFQYTNKLEGMFKDVQNSTELLRRFLQTDGRRFAGKLNLEVNVCTTANWPRAVGTEKPTFPDDLKSICDSYQAFYLREHKAHKLDWRMEKGTAEVMVQFNSQMRRILVVSTYQMMLMLIFNEQETSDAKLSYDFIESRINLSKFVIGHHLLSLCHPKASKVIRKHPNTKDLEGDHQFYINPKYHNDSKKVTIPTLKPPAVIEAQVREEEKAKKLRRNFQIDGAIVRIMKSRKTMKHNDLLQEVVAQLQIRFRPQPSDIKRRVEALIDQEYLERLETDRGSYKYLA